jgi:hypothetical protein
MSYIHKQRLSGVSTFLPPGDSHYTDKRGCVFFSVRLPTVGPGVPYINPLNAELNPICHLLALLGAHRILHVNEIRVNSTLYTVFELNKLFA